MFRISPVASPAPVASNPKVEAYKNAKAFSRKASGYDETSPIWNKPLANVLMEIESKLDSVLGGGSLALGSVDRADVEYALELNRELQKRVGYRALMKAQRS